MSSPTENSGKLEIEPSRFNNENHIEARVARAETSDQGKLRSALKYLYFDEGPKNLPRDRLLAAMNYLDLAETILIRWLYTRTNGSERKNYGHSAMKAAKSARYCCEKCGFADVRCLNLDHIDGRIEGTEFACLCANCHTIKSREKDWSGQSLS